MRKVNLLTKYSLIYFGFFLLFFVILSEMIGASNEALLILTFSGIAFYLISAFFIYAEVNTPLKKIFDLSRQLKLKNEDNEFDQFENKISEVNTLISELEALRSGSVLNKEIFLITEELYSISQRTLHELNTAKIFKINRNEFLGNVAHELRTPIFTIQLSLETLLDGGINDEKVNLDFLSRALNQTRRLKRLVDDLINISKYETNAKMSKRYFGISAMIQRAIDELRELAKNKSISLNFDPANANGVLVFGDEERLQQVLVNLIDNAIKYTPERGEIRISLEAKDKEVSIKIEDNGIGIPKKDLPRIFERFYRVDKNRSRDIGGSGLGLSIVKHILEAHSSQVKVESEEMKGTTFEFNLKR